MSVVCESVVYVCFALVLHECCVSLCDCCGSVVRVLCERVVCESVVYEMVGLRWLCVRWLCVRVLYLRVLCVCVLYIYLYVT